jgi:hypothetical protein
MTLDSMTTALAGATNNPEPSALVSKRSGGDGASDRWKLHSEVDEPCRADSTSPDAAFAFDPNLIHPQSIFAVSPLT